MNYTSWLNVQQQKKNDEDLRLLEEIRNELGWLNGVRSIVWIYYMRGFSPEELSIELISALKNDSICLVKELFKWVPSTDILEGMFIVNPKLLRHFFHSGEIFKWLNHMKDRTLCRLLSNLYHYGNTESLELLQCVFEEDWDFIVCPISLHSGLSSRELDESKTQELLQWYVKSLSFFRNFRQERVLESISILLQHNQIKWASQVWTTVAFHKPKRWVLKDLVLSACQTFEPSVFAFFSEHRMMQDCFSVFANDFVEIMENMLQKPSTRSQSQVCTFLQYLSNGQRPSAVDVNRVMFSIRTGFVKVQNQEVLWFLCSSTEMSDHHGWFLDFIIQNALKCDFLKFFNPHSFVFTSTKVDQLFMTYANRIDDYKTLVQYFECKQKPSSIALDQILSETEYLFFFDQLYTLGMNPKNSIHWFFDLKNKKWKEKQLAFFIEHYSYPLQFYPEEFLINLKRCASSSFLEWFEYFYGFQI
jgi:hypothetical protein